MPDHEKVIYWMTVIAGVASVVHVFVSLYSIDGVRKAVERLRDRVEGTALLAVNMTPEDARMAGFNAGGARPPGARIYVARAPR
jgi:hypothetical protein